MFIEIIIMIVTVTFLLAYFMQVYENLFLNERNLNFNLSKFLDDAASVESAYTMYRATTGEYLINENYDDLIKVFVEYGFLRNEPEPINGEYNFIKTDNSLYFVAQGYDIPESDCKILIEFDGGYVGDNYTTPMKPIDLDKDMLGSKINCFDELGMINLVYKMN